MRHLAVLIAVSLFLVTGCDSSSTDPTGQPGADAGLDALSGTDTGAVTDTGSDTNTDPGNRLEVHGCTFETATDLTGQAAVTLTDAAAWTLGHNACIKVDVGTTVTWEGNFDSHPLVGGVEGSSDATSPITASGPGSGTTPVAVTFSGAGDYPYYCVIHASVMTGVVYVGG